MEWEKGASMRTRERDMWVYIWRELDAFVSVCHTALTTFQFHTFRAELNLQACTRWWYSEIRICWKMWSWDRRRDKRCGNNKKERFWKFAKDSDKFTDFFFVSWKIKTKAFAKRKTLKRWFVQRSISAMAKSIPFWILIRTNDASVFCSPIFSNCYSCFTFTIILQYEINLIAATRIIATNLLIKSQQ